MMMVERNAPAVRILHQTLQCCRLELKRPHSVLFPIPIPSIVLHMANTLPPFMSCQEALGRQEAELGIAKAAQASAAQGWKVCLQW